MRNKKGFTLTEVLATLAILAIILAIAIPSFSKLGEKFEKEYYDNLEKTILASAKTYYKDHPKERPTGILYSSAISLNGLKNNNYIKNANVYKKGDECTGYVVVVNIGEGKYDYKTCMQCNGKNSYSEDDKYCTNKDLVTKIENIEGEEKKVSIDDENINSIDNSSKGIGGTFTTPENLLPIAKNFSMINTFAEFIKEKLIIKPKISRCFGEETAEKCLTYEYKESYSPINISHINLGSESAYKVSYKIENKNEEREVNVVFIATIKEEDGKISSTIKENFSSNLPEYKFSKFEESDDGENWSEVEGCTNNKCDKKIFSKGKVRAIYKPTKDKYKNLEFVSETIEIGVSAPPTCKLKVKSGNNGENGWYTSNVLIEFESKSEDVTGYGLTELNNITYNNLEEYNVDTNGKKTIYGYVKNGAGEGKCEIEINVDKTAPSCSLKVTSGTTGNNNWYKSNVTVGFDQKSSDTTSYGLSTTNTASYNSLTSLTLSNEGNTTIYGYVKDEAGNTAVCRKTINIDKTAPSCSLKVTSGTTGNNNWYTSDVTVGFDQKSTDVTSYGLSTSSTVSYNSKTSLTINTNGSSTIYGFVKDEAGNTAVCSKTIKIDKTAPSCSLKVTSGTTGNNNWYRSNVTVGFDQKSSDTAAFGLSTTNTALYNSSTSLTLENEGNTIVYGYVKDEAGNTAVCSKTIKIDKTAPKLAVNLNNGNYTSGTWTNSDVTRYIEGNDIGGSGIDKYEYVTGDNCTGTISTESLSWIGNNNWKATSSNYACHRVIDKAGNVSDWIESDIKIDKTAPNINVSFKTKTEDGNYTGNYTSGTWTNQNIERKITGSDSESGIFKYQYTNTLSYCETKNGEIDNPNDTIHNESYAGENASWTMNYEGTNTACFRAIDNAGNASDWTQAYKLLIDKTAPDVPTLKYTLGSYEGYSYTPGNWTNQTVYRQIKSSDSDSGIVEFRYKDASYDASQKKFVCNGNEGKETIKDTDVPNDGKFVNYKYYKISYAPTAQNYACFQAVDEAGNKSEWSVPQLIRIDKEPPYVPAVTSITNDIAGLCGTEGEKYNAVQFKNWNSDFYENGWFEVSNSDNLSGAWSYFTNYPKNTFTSVASAKLTGVSCFAFTVQDQGNSGIAKVGIRKCKKENGTAVCEANYEYNDVNSIADAIKYMSFDSYNKDSSGKPETYFWINFVDRAGNISSGLGYARAWNHYAW